MRITRTTLKSFLVSLLGILTAEVGFSNGRQNGSYDDCYNVRGEEICYYLVANEERNWNTAQDKCQNKNLSLPIIRNIEEQAELERYLRKPRNQSINAVWTSGKRNIWTWLNNQTLSTAITISNGYSAKNTHITFEWQNTGAGNILKPERPTAAAWYLCQYKDRQCNGQQNATNATNGCLIPSGSGHASWYGARNECLSKGGDLAILTDQDLQNLKMHKFIYYNCWIGLRRVPKWVWITTNISKATSSGEEVKYTNWARQPTPTEGELCISIATNFGKWRASTCNNSMLSVVCEKRGKSQPSPTTIEKSTESATTTQTTVSISPSTMTATTRRSPTAPTMNKYSVISSTSHPVYAAIGAGVVIVILAIVVILVVILYRKSKSSNNKTERTEIDSETKDKKTKANPSSTTKTEERSIYADIALTEKTATNDDTVEANQKSTVYASLDFDQGGVTYAEPSKLYANTQKNVSSPIYAEPLNGGTGIQKGTTSAGSSPAVKIGPMGDVYALPTTNITPSSSDKTTERAIYANT